MDTALAALSVAVGSAFAWRLATYTHHLIAHHTLEDEEARLLIIRKHVHVRHNDNHARTRSEECRAGAGMGMDRARGAGQASPLLLFSVPILFALRVLT